MFCDGCVALTTKSTEATRLDGHILPARIPKSHHQILITLFSGWQGFYGTCSSYSEKIRRHTSQINVNMRVGRLVRRRWLWFKRTVEEIWGPGSFGLYSLLYFSVS
jgi:hypothetical protein